MKLLKVSPVVFEMLLELSIKKRLKPEVLVESLIKKEYGHN